MRTRLLFTPNEKETDQMVTWAATMCSAGFVQAPARVTRFTAHRGSNMNGNIQYLGFKKPFRPDTLLLREPRKAVITAKNHFISTKSAYLWFQAAPLLPAAPVKSAAKIL